MSATTNATIDWTRYTTAQLKLQVVLHQEGRVTLPSKMLQEVKALISERAAREG